MTDLITPVILAGGSGTRLWPMSRTSRPKQFLQLTGALSLYQQTLARVSDRSVYSDPVVLTNNEYRFVATEQALDMGIEAPTVLLEPVARNTAPAIAAAATYVAKTLGQGATLHILPSDHSLMIDEEYMRAVSEGAAAARAGRHVTFGIVPTGPETGYGYIEPGTPISGEVCEVRRFIEKPDRKKAEELVASGHFLWNSGMFMLGADAFLADCEKLAPQVHAAAVAAVEKAVRDLDFIRLDADAFAASPNISVDYAIFERTENAAVLPVNFAWSDLGCWDAVWKLSEKDTKENVSMGSATFSNTSRSLVVSERAHVAMEGLDDIAVVASQDAIYVGKLSETQKIGAMVKLLQARPETADLTETHLTTYRPWGGYSSILTGERFQVKRLFVKPGKKLSLQKHHHRSEHWIVVRGSAEVTIDGKVTLLSENQSIYLPLGCTHRLANPGKILLELIEVQTGSYLGEDDIIRIEDEFGRA